MSDVEEEAQGGRKNFFSGGSTERKEGFLFKGEQAVHTLWYFRDNAELDNE